MPAGSESTESEESTAAADTERAGSEPNSDDTAAASEAASGQKTTPTKTTKDGENRWAKLSRENRELREKLARAEGRAEGAATRESTQTSQPAAETIKQPEKLVEPKIDDVDPVTRKAKYATFDEYLAAVRKYDRDSLLAELKSDQSKTEQQRASEQTERIIEQTVNERVEKAKKTHSDYEATMKAALDLTDEFDRPAFFYTKGSALDGFFLDSDIGHEVMYHVAKNFDQYKSIFARDKSGRYLMNPVRQLRELTKIEAKIEAKLESSSSSSRSTAAGAEKTGSSGKPVSQAPRPPHQTSGQGTVTADAIEQAVKESDQDTYMREQNARDLARRKRG